jgi:hypothetical protein
MIAATTTAEATPTTTTVRVVTTSTIVTALFFTLLNMLHSIAVSAASPAVFAGAHLLGVPLWRIAIAAPVTTTTSATTGTAVAALYAIVSGWRHSSATVTSGAATARAATPAATFSRGTAALITSPGFSVSFVSLNKNNFGARRGLAGLQLCATEVAFRCNGRTKTNQCNA